MDDGVLVEVAVEAEAQLRDELARGAPALHRAVEDWLDDAFGRDPIAEALAGQDAFPMLLIPWWIDGGAGEPNRQLHRLTTYSTMNGCLFTRLIGDVAADDELAGSGILAALGFFHLEFLRPYRRLFPSGHRFWDDLRSIWIDAAATTFESARPAHVDRAAFEQLAAVDTGVVRVPIAAVWHYGGAAVDTRKRWDEFAAAMGRWQRLADEMLGWRRHLAAGAASYFLSEGRRQRPDAVEAWASADGVAWATAELAAVMHRLKDLAVELDATEALWYLEERQERVAARVAGMRQAEAVAVRAAPG